MNFDPRDGSLISSESGRRKLVDALVENNFGVHPLRPQSPDNLPRKYLGPGHYSDLYRVYQAQQLALNRPAASAATFFRTLVASEWEDKLRFRAVKTHAQCSQCHALKAKIRKSKDLQTHALAADQYMRHLAGVYADRQAYSQSKARAIQQRDLLVLIVDSMDKSKFMLPRYSQGITPKSLETKKRPSCELTAVILHGHGLYVWVTDPEQSKGSNWSHEVILRSLEKAFAKNQEKGQPWPRALRIFSDNTPKEPWNIV